MDILNEDLMFVLPPRDTFDDLGLKLSELGGKRIRLIVQIKEKEEESNDDNKQNNDKDTDMSG